MTGLACPIFYRRELRTSVKSFVFIGVAPTLGALMLVAAFIKSSSDLWGSADTASLQDRRAVRDRLWVPDRRGDPHVHPAGDQSGVLPQAARHVRPERSSAWRERRSVDGRRLTAAPLLLGYDGSNGAKVALEEAARIANGLGVRS